MFLIRRLLVITLAVSILSNSSQSLFNDSYIFLVINSVSTNRSNQYLDSFASFNPMLSLCIKSLVLSECSASLMIAPIDVPLLINCFDKMYSPFAFLRYLYKLTILTANSKLLCFKMFCFMGKSLGINNPKIIIIN